MTGGITKLILAGLRRKGGEEMITEEIIDARFVAMLEHNGWKKEMVIHHMLPDIEMAVLEELKFYHTLEEPLPELPDIKKVRFFLEGVKKIVIENGIKTYYLKYKKY